MTSLDLETLPDEYLARTNYQPMADQAEYAPSHGQVSWSEEESVDLPVEATDCESGIKRRTGADGKCDSRPQAKRVTEYFRLDF